MARKQPAPDATTHRFTNPTPLIFPDLHHPDGDAPGVHIVRADQTAGQERGNVVLYFGDEVTLPLDYQHAWLELINPPAASAAPSADEAPNEEHA